MTTASQTHTVADNKTLSPADVCKASTGESEHPEVIQWDEAEESHLTRKLDFRLVPIAFLLYLLCFIDR